MELEAGEDLFLYRYIDWNEGGLQYWIISLAIGTLPDDGYAYCGPDTGTGKGPYGEDGIGDITTPDGNCDGKWRVGIQGSKEIDPYFKLMAGGCEQVIPSKLTLFSDPGDFFTPDAAGVGAVKKGVFEYYQPNIYRQTNALSESGYFYLFWNPSVWTWAVNEYMNDDLYRNCENYKKS